MRPPCHISNFKNSFSYQTKQRTETTGYLPELSPQHTGMQICLTTMTSSQGSFSTLLTLYQPGSLSFILDSSSLPQPPFPPTRLPYCLFGLSVVFPPFLDFQVKCARGWQGRPTLPLHQGPLYTSYRELGTAGC